MFNSLKAQWEGLRRGRPGHRFRTAYADARKNRSPLWYRALQLILAAVVLVVGVVFAFIPGPAVVFFAIAGALLAAESRPVAVALDWVEVQLRRVGKWAKAEWKEMGPVGRTLVVAAGALMSLATTALTLWTFFGR
jgi:hypothetical protein